MRVGQNCMNSLLDRGSLFDWSAYSEDVLEYH